MIRYRDIGEKADRVLSSAWFFVGFNLLVAGALRISLDAGNLLISIITAYVLLLGAGIARAAWKALHAKLDALIGATPGASDALIRAEDRDEAEIAELRL